MVEALAKLLDGNVHAQVVLYVAIAQGVALGIPWTRYRVPLLVASVVIILATAVLRLASGV